jgi:hypothetical protein
VPWLTLVQLLTRVRHRPGPALVQFNTLLEAQVLVDDWLVDYNRNGRRSSNQIPLHRDGH